MRGSFARRRSRWAVMSVFRISVPRTPFVRHVSRPRLPDQYRRIFRSSGRAPSSRIARRTIHGSWNDARRVLLTIRS